LLYFRPANALEATSACVWRSSLSYWSEFNLSHVTIAMQ
jgi:hypothetical protein